MPFLKFLVYTVIGTIIWNTVLVMAGSIVGDKWEMIVNVINRYTSVTLIILILLIIIAITIYIKKRIKN